MSKVAYLANSFPEAIEPYVWEEICELRRRGRAVVACSFRRPKQIPVQLATFSFETLYVFPLRIRSAIFACWACTSRIALIFDILLRAIAGPEPTQRRLRTLAHTWLGAYLAVTLRKEQITHIHIHHGYFSSWAGMVAARLLGATFSMTLHGSDLLVRADYLDCKLKHCRFCITVSEFNRAYIRDRYPDLDRGKILVHRLGVDLDFWRPPREAKCGFPLSILSVGRLHPIKNHEFLISACHELKALNVPFRCMIAGDGGDRGRLQKFIRALDLENEVELCGHVPRERLPLIYSQADVMVVTSHSEGIPQTLMEAMAMERVVLAPEITGIPELICDQETGFLYRQNSMPDFLEKLIRIASEKSSFGAVRHQARRFVHLKFNHQRNLNAWADDFIERINSQTKKESSYENPVLQQVQLPVQRDRSISV